MLSLRPGKNSCAAVSPSKGTKIARNRQSPAFRASFSPSFDAFKIRNLFLGEHPVFAALERPQVDVPLADPF